MDVPESLPAPDILWSQIREAERTAPEHRPVVLVVEDDPTVRLFTRYALRTVVRTDAASTVADALRLAETLPYDGLLVDLRLPDGAGTDLVDELREQTPYWGVPMVAVTAHRLPEGQGHYLDAGFDAYLAKPFEAEDLRTLVRHLVVESDEAVDRGRKLVRRERPRPTLSREDEDEAEQAPATSRLGPLPES